MLLGTDVLVTSVTSSSKLLKALTCTWQVYLFKGWWLSPFFPGSEEYLRTLDLMKMRWTWKFSNLRVSIKSIFFFQQKFCQCVWLWSLSFPTSEQSHSCFLLCTRMPVLEELNSGSFTIISKAYCLFSGAGFFFTVF